MGFRLRRKPILLCQDFFAQVRCHGLHQFEIHMGIVEGLQVVVHGLGLGQRGNGLLHQGGGHLFGEAEPGAAAAEQFLVRCRVQPDAAVGGAGEGQVGGGGEEGQVQLRDQQVGQPLGGHGVGAGDYVPALRRDPGQQVDQKLVGQPVAVRQLVDAAALGLGRLKEAEGACVGYCPQELLFDLFVGGALFLPQLPGQDAPGPFGHLLRQAVGEQGGALVLEDFRRRPQAAVGPLVAALVAGHAGDDVPAQGGKTLGVVAQAHVYVPLHHAGVLGFHHVGNVSLGHLLSFEKESRQRKL